MIRALIVDDEQMAREELQALLEATGAFELLASCANGFDAVKAINEHRPEVVFLDIEMPVINGFQLLSMVDEERMPQVVFVTAYDEFALKAFEEKTLDYLLKPVRAGAPGPDPGQIEKRVAAGGNSPLRHACFAAHPLLLRAPGQACGCEHGGSGVYRPQRRAPAYR